MYLSLYSFLTGYKGKKSQDEGLVCLFLIYALALDLLRLTVTATPVGRRNQQQQQQGQRQQLRQTIRKSRMLHAKLATRGRPRCGRC